MPGRFVIQKYGKEFRWSLVAANGRVVATGEHYDTRRAALAGIESVKRNAPGAVLVEGGEEQTPSERIINAAAKLTGLEPE